MPLPPISDLLDISDVSRKFILHKHQLTEEDAASNAKKILEWFESQPFMGKVSLEQKELENFYIQNKGSFEKTKQSIINYNYLKMAVPELFTNRDPLLPELRETLKGLAFCIQYPLSKSGERYVYVEFKDEPEKLNVHAYFKLFYMELEIKMRHDFAGDMVLIINAHSIKKEHIDHLFKHVRTMALSVYATQHAFGQEYKKFHFINVPEIAKGLVQRMNTLVEKNISFVIHKDLASLHRSVDRELLPKSLGGDQENVEEVQEKWLQKANSWREWFLEDDKQFAEF